MSLNIDKGGGYGAETSKTRIDFDRLKCTVLELMISCTICGTACQFTPLGLSLHSIADGNLELLMLVHVSERQDVASMVT
jgi:hypothetical protein